MTFILMAHEHWDSKIVNIVFRHLAMRQPCVQLNVFQINDTVTTRQWVFFIVEHEKGNNNARE
jgi:hypothetical protein